jgi:5'-methylthioadenosine phosphorylase
MEGPAFSTRAESEMHRSWGASVIGMTAMPEAKLAREAELGYCMLALCTDYDCWHQAEAEVSVEAVVAVVAANVERAKRTVAELARRLPESAAELPWPRALEGAILTAPESISAGARERLSQLLGRGPESKS